MFKKIFPLIFTFVFIVVIMVGCKPANPTFPSGDYVDDMGFMISFYPDGKFMVSYPDYDEGIVNNGQYSVDGETISINENESCPPGDGVYKWSLDGDLLILELVEDNCENRVLSFADGLTRVPLGD